MTTSGKDVVWQALRRALSSLSVLGGNSWRGGLMSRELRRRASVAHSDELPKEFTENEVATATKREVPAPPQRPKWSLRSLCIFLFCLLVAYVALCVLFGWTPLLISTGPFQQADQTARSRPSSGPRLVAVGDIHGDLLQAERVLSLMNLINENGTWVGGDAILVQTGDLVDRGPDSFEVVKLFEELKMAAKKKGGQVHTLLGNHELMNLQSNFRYISRQELVKLGAKNDLQLPGLFQEDLKQEPWFKKMQLKSENEKKGALIWWGALQKGGWFGDVLRKKPVVLMLGEGACKTVFVHGGLNLKMLKEVNLSDKENPQKALDRMNERISKALENCPGKNCEARTKEGYLLGVDGLLWYRGFQALKDSVLCPEVRKVLEALGASRIVSGHNIQVDKKVRSRCGGLIQLIDVGMSRAYLGTLAGLECVNGQAIPRYPSKISKQDELKLAA